MCIHNFDKKINKYLIHDRLIWMRFSQRKLSKKSDTELIKKKKKSFKLEVDKSNCNCIQAVKQFCPTNTDMLTAPYFSFIFISAQTLGFWEPLASHMYAEPETTRRCQPGSSSLHYTHSPFSPSFTSRFYIFMKHLSFLRMCFWGAVWSGTRLFQSDDLTLLQEMQMMFSLNCWEATIWFIRCIVLISLTQNGGWKEEACWWSYRRISSRMWCGCKNNSGH